MTKGGDILDENSNPVDRVALICKVLTRVMGVELDFVAEPTRWLTINGMLSVGDWQWIVMLPDIITMDKDNLWQI